MGQKPDRREQIYKKNEDETWARRLTTKSKSIEKASRGDGQREQRREAAEGKQQRREDGGQQRGRKRRKRRGGRKEEEEEEDSLFKS